MQAKLDLDAALQNVQDFHATRRNAQGRRQTLDEQVAERGHVGLDVRKAVAVDVECSFSRQQRGLRCHRCLSLGRQLRGPLCIGLGRQLGSFLLLRMLLHYLRLGQQRLLRLLLRDDRSEPQSPSRRGAAARRRVRHLRLLGSHRRRRLAPVHRRRRQRPRRRGVREGQHVVGPLQRGQQLVQLHLCDAAIFLEALLGDCPAAAPLFQQLPVHRQQPRQLVPKNAGDVLHLDDRARATRQHAQGRH
mmetsp:Transcript_158887/g.509542  ORF Transcript_158887/g.509542 Transcript_158887/m.509542 type:complete len:246 (+) Transcript_158887:859-1596(+)